MPDGRSPHRERGLKSSFQNRTPIPVGRSPHRERGLKSRQSLINRNFAGRSPHRERGLKSAPIAAAAIGRSPHRERGLKFALRQLSPALWVSLPSQGAWIEIECVVYCIINYMSLPSQGAWIEIYCCSRRCYVCDVAPLTGSVD